MSDSAPVDARAFCNLLLDEAERFHWRITNLSLQKLLYFAHGLHLIETKKPLVGGYFEAWKLGPVHPGAYRAFKSAGARVIQFRAYRENPLTKETSPIAVPGDSEVRARAIRVVSTYGGMSAAQLVEIAHASCAPWQFIVDKARTSTTFGLRIPDIVIAERFKYHKVAIGPPSGEQELGENTPFE